MQLATAHDRAEPTEGRAALMRQAADLYGPEALARDLGVSSRSLYYWMDGKRAVRDGVLADTRKLLISRRQSIADLVALFRTEEAGEADA